MRPSVISGVYFSISLHTWLHYLACVRTADKGGHAPAGHQVTSAPTSYLNMTVFDSWLKCKRGHASWLLVRACPCSPPADMSGARWHIVHRVGIVHRLHRYLYLVILYY